MCAIREFFEEFDDDLEVQTLHVVNQQKTKEKRKVLVRAVRVESGPDGDGLGEERAEFRAFFSPLPISDVFRGIAVVSARFHH